MLRATAGQAEDVRGHRVPLTGTTSGEVLLQGRAVRVRDAARNLRMDPNEVGVAGAENALIVPMAHRGEPLGVLIAFDRGAEREAFTAADVDRVLGDL